MSKAYPNYFLDTEKPEMRIVTCILEQPWLEVIQRIVLCSVYAVRGLLLDLAAQAWDASEKVVC